MSSGHDAPQHPSKRTDSLWLTVGRLWHSNTKTPDPEVEFCSELTAKVVLISTVLFYMDLVTDCLVLQRCLQKDPPDWPLFTVTLATSVLPNVFFCYQVWNYAHIMKSVGSSVRWSCIQALTYTLPAVAIYKKFRFGKDPIEWRANLFGSARSFCANLPCHFFQFLKAFDPDTPPALRRSVLVSCMIVYLSSGIAAFRYHLEIGEPTNLQKYRLCGFSNNKKWLFLLLVNSLVSSFVKLIGPALVAVLYGMGPAVVIPAAHTAVNVYLHLGNVARIRGMGWNPETGKLIYSKWLNASLSAVAQRYLLDLVFIRAPNALFLAKHEGGLVLFFAICCISCVFSRFGADPDPITRTEPGSFMNPRAWPEDRGYELFVFLYVLTVVLFAVFRITVQVAFKVEIRQRAQTAETWLAGMDEKRADAQKTWAEAKAAGFESTTKYKESMDLAAQAAKCEEGPPSKESMDLAAQGAKMEMEARAADAVPVAESTQESQESESRIERAFI